MNVSHDQLNKIDEYLNLLIIDISYVSNFYGTEKTKGIIDRVNAKIGVLLEKTRQLKSLFEAHEKKLLEIVKKQKDDINEFLAIAGFPYNGDYCGNMELQYPDSKTPEIGIDLMEDKRNKGIAPKIVRLFVRKV